MRIKNTLYNSIVAILSYVSLAVLGIILRKYFLQFLPTEYLGYEGLFSDIFAILGVGELGINGVILYKMYPALANQDETAVAKLMAVYKLLYTFVGTGIAIVGIGLLPFLHFIIRDNSLRWSYVYVVYGLQLVVALCGYFLAYKRVLLMAAMREAVATKIETTSSFVSTIVKIIVILATKNYILYILVGVINNIVLNSLIAIKVNKDYPYIKSVIKITKADIQDLGIGHDLKNNLIQKISTAIYGGTDSILISALLGISQVGLLSNYALLSGHVTNLMSKILNPFQASIGNFVHSANRDRAEGMFNMFDRISFFMATFISISFCVLYNPFVELVFGHRFLLSQLYVVMFAVNQYIAYNHKFLYFFRAAFGKFEMDKWYALAAAILNIVCSVVLSRSMGIAGIMLGTVIGHMGFWIGRIIVVFSEYLKGYVGKYLVKQAMNTFLWLVEMGLTYYLCSFFSNSICGFFVKAMLCLMIPNILNLILYSKSKDMKMILDYIGKSKQAVVNKGDVVE